jgi:hypothetical protein
MWYLDSNWKLKKKEEENIQFKQTNSFFLDMVFAPVCAF